jgi:uncharacterized membrane protein YphA (DoxX/SURF4 family)
VGIRLLTSAATQDSLLITPMDPTTKKKKFWSLAGSGKLSMIIALVARWFLGAVFIYMGLVKALDPVTFLKLVREYEMVGNPLLLNLIASVLPWFEVFCGVLLLAGVAVRGTALMVLGMLIPFTLIVLKRALEIASAEGILFCAVKFNCGCGGGDVYICQKLIENTGLMLLTLFPLAGLGKKLSLRFSFWPVETVKESPSNGMGLELGEAPSNK